jgi:hypothetical protein
MPSIMSGAPVTLGGVRLHPLIAATIAANGDEGIQHLTPVRTRSSGSRSSRQITLVRLISSKARRVVRAQWVRERTSAYAPVPPDVGHLQAPGV